MKYLKNKNATVLVYTLFLVVLTVFMAAGLLNLSTQLEVDSQRHSLDADLTRQIQLKAGNILQNNLRYNTNGGGFVDKIGCPQGITMSGNTLRTENINTELRYIGGSILCQSDSSSLHGGEGIRIYFNDDLNDIERAAFSGIDITVNSGTLVGNFSDTDDTRLDLGSTAYLAPDGYDDDFNDDDLTPYSSGGLLAYPDGYTDDDAHARTHVYGYVWGTGADISQAEAGNNMYVMNADVRKTIAENIYNTGAAYLHAGDASAAKLQLSVSEDFILEIYKLDKTAYDSSREIRVLSYQSGGIQSSGTGYIQLDGSISGTSTASDYVFDFQNSDYALFIKNPSGLPLRYELWGESGGQTLYLAPLKFRIGTTQRDYAYYAGGYAKREKEDLVVYTPTKSPGLALPREIPNPDIWFDAADSSTIFADASGNVSRWKDKSPNANDAIQANSLRQPGTGLDSLNGYNLISFNDDFLQLESQANYRTLFFVVKDTIGITNTKYGSIIGEDAGFSQSYIFLHLDSSDAAYDISIDGVANNTGVAYHNGGAGDRGTNINLGLSRADVGGAGIWTVVQDEGTPFDLIGKYRFHLNYHGYSRVNMAELIAYDRVLTTEEMNEVGNYLSNKWGIIWTDVTP